MQLLTEFLTKTYFSFFFFSEMEIFLENLSTYNLGSLYSSFFI